MRCFTVKENHIGSVVATDLKKAYYFFKRIKIEINKDDNIYKKRSTKNYGWTMDICKVS